MRCASTELVVVRVPLELMSEAGFFPLSVSRVLSISFFFFSNSFVLPLS